jgi:hypothetical protein
MSVAHEFSHDWVSSIGIRRRKRFLSPLKGQLRPLRGIETCQNRSAKWLVDNIAEPSARAPRERKTPASARRYSPISATGQRC